MAAPCFLCDVDAGCVLPSTISQFAVCIHLQVERFGRRGVWLQTCAAVTPAACALLCELLRLCVYPRLPICAVATAVALLLLSYFKQRLG